MNYKGMPKSGNKYILTFLVWNNLLALLITLVVPRSGELSFLGDLACVLVVSHVTAFICLISIDLFRPLQKRLFGLEERTLYLSSLIPMSVVVVPALIAGFYASIWFAKAFSINWHPEVSEVVMPGILFSFIIFVLNLLYYNYVYSVRAYYQKEMEFKTVQAAALESKLQVYMSELNPHMLFNALNAIIAVVRTDGARAENMLLELCDYYQSVLVAFEKRSVKLLEELELCEKFIALHRHKSPNLHVDVWVENAQLKNYLLPPLILQPLLENSLRHGFISAAQEKEKTIRIDVRQHESRIYLRVIDNGIGLSNEHVRAGVGLKNCEERLKGLLGSSSVLSMSGNAEGTTVLLDLPYVAD